MSRYYVGTQLMIDISFTLVTSVTDIIHERLLMFEHKAECLIDLMS